MSSDDIQGKVTDASGNAVANALVALWSQGSPNNVKTTQADSNGNYIFSGHPDGDGTSQNWHIAARNPNDGSQQFPSLHSVSASLPAIPDSVVVIQYDGETFTTGDPSWSDDVGSADMSITGDPQSTTLSSGPDSVQFDGTDDHGLTNFPASLEGSSLTSSAIEFELEVSETGDGYLFGQRNNDANQYWAIALNVDGSFNTEDGNFHFIYADDSGNQTSFAPTNNPNINDGNEHTISISVDDSTTDSYTVIIDGTEVSLSYLSQESPSSFTTWDNSMGFACRNLGGSVTRESAVNIAQIRLHDSDISGQTI